jgi:DNA topoisomerase III
VKLILTENRAKAKMLAKPFESQDKQTHILTQPCSLFPEGAVFLWTDGHVISLAEPAAYQPSYADWSLDSLPILPNSFKYTVLKDKTAQFTICQRFLTAPEVSQVILATDSTEDGEVIGQLIRVLSGCKKPVIRMWLHSLTESEIEKAFTNPHPANAKVHLFNASMARRYADWLVNTNATRFYTLLNQQQSGQQETFSVDRIHTALISHIIKREDDILSFKSAPFYEVVSSFIYQGSIYQGKWFKAEIERLQVAEQASVLANFCSGKSARVVSVTKERHEEEPPPFLTLSTIQTQANQYYGLSPQEVYEACERLYSQGLISCPVTENPYITEEQANTFPDLLNKLRALSEYASITPDPLDFSCIRYVDDRNCRDYCAIIPTENIPNIDELSDKERKIYDLVLRSIVASFHSIAVFEEKTVITLINNSFSFRTKNRFLVEPGWKQVYQALAKEETVDKSPCVIEGQNVIVAQMNIKQDDTLPPERFSEIELIQLMKNNGFGTPAMRSSIISMLKEQQYIALKNQQVYPLEKGRQLIKLIGKSVLTSMKDTTEWEKKIAAIGEGKLEIESFLADVRALTSSLFPNRIDTQAPARPKQESAPIQDAEEQQLLPEQNPPLVPKEINDQHSTCGFEIKFDNF